LVHVADLPVDFTGDLADRLMRALDREGKIARALEALGPVVDRDVLVVDADGGARARELTRAGARAVAHRPAAAHAGPADRASWSEAASSFDAVVGYWSAFRAPSEAEVDEADRVLRPGGRLLVVHDYGRDDVSRLLGDRPEYGSWSKRDGWYLKSGFKMRVIHAFWTFETLDETRDFLVDGFGEIGATVAATLKRPRLSYNVAVYHRTRGDQAPPSSPPAARHR
jgi:SAM-dependent methyltransferase